MSELDMAEVHKALHDLPNRDGDTFNAIDRAGACDYFRSKLISSGISPEQTEKFLKYIHSEAFRSSITDDDLTITSFEAMLAVDEGVVP